MSKTKRYISLILMICFVISIVGSAEAFVQDIQGHWAQATIEKWIDDGLIAGYSDGSFKPDNQISRAEFIVMINRALGKSSENSSCSYIDVKASDWFYKDLEISQAAGYVSGYPDGTFRPNQYISRQEVAAIIAAILKSKSDGTHYSAEVADYAQIAEWSRAAINNVLGNKIMNGYPDGSFKPESKISRAEALVTLENAIQIDPGTGNIGNDDPIVNVITASETKDKSRKTIIREVTDSDGDGLKDYQEILMLGTDPLHADTDGNGIKDGNEDFDEDGITNAEELVLNGDPFSNDTDNDGLLDNEEKNIGTMLNNSDSDNDKLSDSKELDLGTDPLNPDSNGNGILDGDEIYPILLSADENDVDERAKPTIELDLQGAQINTLSISRINNDFFLSEEIPGFIGSGYDFYVNGPFCNALLTFEFDATMAENEDFVPRIYFFNGETQMLEELPDQIVDGNRVTATLTHFSRYILLNKKAFDEVWVQQIRPPAEGGAQASAMDLALVIDGSGSMTWSDPTDIRFEAARLVIDALGAEDRVAVIGFDNNAYLKSDFTLDREAAKTAIESTFTNGGTSIYNGINKALDQFDAQPRDAINNMIVLSDGDDNYLYNYSPVLERANSKDITIYTIGLGSYVNVGLLSNIATSTNGKYYHASVAGELLDEFNQAQEEIDLNKDSDGDGLSDYHEKRIRLGNGTIISTDINKKDTDGDGLNDGEEIKVVYAADGSILYYIVESNPIKQDTDDDGFLDNEDATPLVAKAFKDIETYKKVKFSDDNVAIIFVQQPIPGSRFVIAGIENKDVGHTFISIGSKYGGFYPLGGMKELEILFRASVTGAINTESSLRITGEWWLQDEKPTSEDRENEHPWNIAKAYKISADNASKMVTFRNKFNKKYNMVSKNCTTFAVEALKAGNITPPTTKNDWILPMDVIDYLVDMCRDQKWVAGAFLLGLNGYTPADAGEDIREKGNYITYEQIKNRNNEYVNAVVVH